MIDIEVSYIEIICEREIAVTYLIVIITSCMILFLEPTLGPFLQVSYKLNNFM